MDDRLALPVPAESLIPHRRPMRLVDTLVSRGETEGVTESRVPADSPLADADGTLDEVLFVELIAQSFAAVKGHRDLVDGIAPKDGYLVAVNRMKIAGRAAAGDLLRTSVRLAGSFSGFAVVEGTVARGDEVVASGSLKLWVPE